MNPLRSTLALLEREAARRAKGTHSGMMRLADDEQHPAGLSRYERATAVVRRHLDRVDERSFVLPRAIGDEWSRIEACSDPKVADEPICR